MFYRLILLFFALISSLTWASNDIALINSKNTSINVGEIGGYYIDDTKQLGINEITSDSYDRRFLPLSDEFLQFGLVDGNIWIKLKVAIQTSLSTPVVLSVHAPRLQYLDVYMPSVFETQAQAETGELRPFENRPINHANYIFPLPANTPPVFSLYIKASSRLPINISANIETLSSFSERSQFDFTMTGVMMGILILLFISNLFFFFTSRHPMYMVYGCMLISIAVLHLALHGQVYQYFPQFTGLQERLYNLAALTCISAIALFSRLYLDTKSAFPKLDKVIYSVGLLNVFLATIYAVSPPLLSILYLSTLAFLTLYFLFGVAVYAKIKKVPHSGYYVFARTVLLIGHTTWLLSAYGVIPSEFWFEWGLTTSIIAEALIHYSAMVMRLNPYIRRASHLVKEASAHNPELYADLSSRLRRQIKVYDGFLANLSKTSNANETLLETGKSATNNLKHIVERIDFYHALKDKPKRQQPQSEAIVSVIERAYFRFHELDQDHSDIELTTQALDNIEVLENIELLCHLFEILMMEFKHFTDQSLNMTFSVSADKREGGRTLKVVCGPVPSRIAEESVKADISLSYIQAVVKQLDGKLWFAGESKERTAIVECPILAHEQKEQSSFDLLTGSDFEVVVYGESSPLMSKTLILLQNWSSSIIQVQEQSELAHLFEESQTLNIGHVLIMFEDQKNLPIPDLKRVKPLLKSIDRCVLITNNIKMSTAFSQIIGFDSMISESEIDVKLVPYLTGITRRLVRNSMSEINKTRS
ncbi:7TMR-DISM family protein [Marinomonas balearica]|uniref:7TMR-DISM extracellular protein 2 n=1 Tax=Marinomonas balearica TaxID=491947 RepID=A0A4R6MC58_9GAMM|nr:7TM diverse intracellular signaling domain-containing protein [Marinomonas balearica]TDO98725.1 7TMR-DISM extracellular protein 2 [Marinomonas balearica]